MRRRRCAAGCLSRRGGVQTEEEKAVKVDFLRLIGMVRPEWWLLIPGMFASLVLGLVQPAFAVMLSRMIDSLRPEADLDRGLAVVYFFAGLAGVTLFFALIQARAPSSPLHTYTPPVLCAHVCRRVCPQMVKCCPCVY